MTHDLPVSAPRHHSIALLSREHVVAVAKTLPPLTGNRSCRHPPLLLHRRRSGRFALGLLLSITCMVWTISRTGWTATAQTVKINVFTAKSPQVGIDGGFNVQTSGALTNLTGLTYRDTYAIADVFGDNQNALAMNWNALGVIGESTMLVDEYQVTADNITLLDEPGCKQFFAELNRAPDYYRFDTTLKNTTAFIGVHQNQWLVLLPRGYRVNEQIIGYGTVYANSTAFVNDGVPAKALIGNRRGSCGIRWVPPGSVATEPTQTILIEFSDPAAAGTTTTTNATTTTTSGTLQTNSTTNTTTTVPRNTINTTTALSNSTSSAAGTTATITRNIGWTSLVGVGTTLWALLVWFSPLV